MSRIFGRCLCLRMLLKADSAFRRDEYNGQPFVVAKSIEDFSWLMVQILFLPPDEVFWQQPVAFLPVP